MTELACRILASWRFGMTPPGHYGSGRSDPPDVPRGNAPAGQAPAAGWEWPTVPEGPAMDALQAALAPWVAGEMPLIVRPEGVHLRADVVLLLGHDGEPVAHNIAVTRQGEQFTATGWVAPEAAAELRRYRGVSPAVQIRAAAIVDVGPVRFVDATTVVMVELSATDEPVDASSTLLVGAPEPVAESDAARFAGEEYDPGTFRAHSDAAEGRYQARLREQAAAVRA